MLFGGKWNLQKKKIQLVMKFTYSSFFILYKPCISFASQTLGMLILNDFNYSYLRNLFLGLEIRESMVFSMHKILGLNSELWIFLVRNLNGSCLNTLIVKHKTKTFPCPKNLVKWDYRGVNQQKTWNWEINSTFSTNIQDHIRWQNNHLFKMKD